MIITMIKWYKLKKVNTLLLNSQQRLLLKIRTVTVHSSQLNLIDWNIEIEWSIMKYECFNGNASRFTEFFCTNILPSVYSSFSLSFSQVTNYVM